MSGNDGEVLLQEILSASLDDEGKNPTPKRAPTAVDEDSPKAKEKETHSQWALGGNGRFVPVGSTVAKLPAGIYSPFATPGMWGLEKLEVESDDIYILPDMATDVVLKEVQKFWDSEKMYRQHKLLYKRGIILWGPPGGGKTVAVKILMQELVKRDGIVINVSAVDLAIMCLKAIRRIEAKRNLIVVFEDIDEIINYNGEASVLSMLDGENNVDNVLHLATTNYPDRLGARIINRPSRFDRRVLVGMPSAEARSAYLDKATNGGLGLEDKTKWTEDSEGMSIAHLRELVAAVYCLDQPYAEVIERLQIMAKPINAVDDGFTRKLGFGMGAAIRKAKLPEVD